MRLLDAGESVPPSLVRAVSQNHFLLVRQVASRSLPFTSASAFETAGSNAVAP
jgi:hypothetical protein